MQRPNNSRKQPKRLTTPKFPKRLNEVLSVIAEQQACFSEFRFAPYTGLGSEWVQLGLEGGWSGALLCGYGGEHVAPAQLVRLGWCLAWRVSRRCPE